MNKKVQLAAFVTACAILVVFTIYKGHPLHNNCIQCGYFYKYR